MLTASQTWSRQTLRKIKKRRASMIDRESTFKGRATCECVEPCGYESLDERLANTVEMALAAHPMERL